jgi:hypothetical protein
MTSRSQRSEKSANVRSVKIIRNYNIIAPMFEIMEKFSKQCQEVAENGTVLYGRAPHIGKKAFLHTIYPPLSDEGIKFLSTKIGRSIPAHLAEFYKECNGLHYFGDTLSIDGMRTIQERGLDAFYQPYDLVTPNIDERIKKSTEDSIFFGGYDWDGSLIFTKTTDESVYICSPDSPKPLKDWGSISDFILSEAERIESLFDSKGIRIEKSKSTLPV